MTAKDLVQASRVFSITISSQHRQDQRHLCPSTPASCPGKSRGTDDVCETLGVPSVVDRSLFILLSASSHSASTEEPAGQAGGTTLHNEALGQQTEVPMVDASPQSNHTMV